MKARCQPSAIELKVFEDLFGYGCGPNKVDEVLPREHWKNRAVGDPLVCGTTKTTTRREKDMC
jgi:hypothetical protein